MAGGMEKRIANIVTQFSVEGEDEVKRALRDLRRSVLGAGAKSDSVSNVFEKTETAAKSTTKEVVRLDETLVDASRSADALGDAASGVAPNLDKGTDSAEALRAALRRLRGLGDFDLFGGGSQAGADELLRYAAEVKKTAKKLDDLKAQRDALGLDAAPAFDGAIAEERRRLAYYTQRMADGTSEDAERAALARQKQAAEEATRQFEANAKERLAIQRDLEQRGERIRQAADKAAYAEVQKLRRAWREFGDRLFADTDRIVTDLEVGMGDVGRTADETAAAMRTVRIPPSMSGIEAVRAMRRAHEDAAYAAKLHSQFVKETGRDYDALAAASRKVRFNQFHGPGVQAMQQYAAAQRQIQQALQQSGRAPSFAGVTQQFARLRQAAQGTVQSLRNFRQALGANLNAAGPIGRLRSAFVTLRGTIRGIGGIAKSAFAEVRSAGLGVATALTSAFSNLAKTIAKITFNDNMLEALPYIAAAAGAYTFAPAVGLLGGAAAAAAGVYTMQDVQPVRETAAALNMPAEQVDMFRYMFGNVGGEAQQGLDLLKTTREQMLEVQVEETKFQQATAKAVEEHRKAVAEFAEAADGATSALARIGDITFDGPSGTRVTPAMLGLDERALREEVGRALASGAGGAGDRYPARSRLAAADLVGKSAAEIAQAVAGSLATVEQGARAGKGPKPPELDLPEREIDSLGRILKDLGIEVRDSTGKFKDVTSFVVEVAKKWKQLSSEERTFLMSKLYGSEAATDYSLMFDKLAGDPELLARMEKFSSAGLFVTDEQIATLAKFTTMWNDLQLVLKALARELFLAFEPFFGKYAAGFTAFFLDVEKRQGLIEKVFVKPFERAWRFVQDIMRAWFSFDFDNFLMGTEVQPVAPENEWLFTLKKVAQDVWMLLQGVWNVIAGIGEALGGLFVQFDAAGERMSGFSFIDWPKGPAAAVVLSFTADLRKVLADLFTGDVVDPAAMTTWLGEAVRARLEQFKELISSVLTPTLTYLDEAWQQFWGGIQAGTGLEGTTNTLSQLGLLAVAAAEGVGKLSEAVVAAFSGAEAPEGYGWVTELAGTLVELKDALVGIVGALTPVYEKFDALSQALLGINGATTLIVAGIGIKGIYEIAKALAALRTAVIVGGVASGVVAAGAGVGLAGTLAAMAAPLVAISLAIGAVAGGIYVLYNILTDFTGTVDAVVAAIKTAWEYLTPDRKGMNDAPTMEDRDAAIDDAAYNLADNRQKLQDTPAEDVERRESLTRIVARLEIMLADAIKAKAEAVEVQANLSPEASATLAAAATRSAPLDPTRALGMQQGTVAAKVDYQAQVAEVEAANAELKAQAAAMQTASAEVTSDTTEVKSDATEVKADKTQVKTGTAEVKADSVTFTSTGSNVTIVLPNGGTATGYYKQDQANALRQALDSRISR